MRITYFLVNSRLHFQHWIDRGFVGPSSDPRTTPLTIDHPSRSEYSDAGTSAILDFDHNYESTNYRYGYRVEQAALLRIRFDHPRRMSGYDGVVNVIKLVHGLAAIGCHLTIPIERIFLGIQCGSEKPLEAQLMRQWKQNDNVRNVGEIAGRTRLFTFENVRGLKGLVRWTNLADRFALPMLLVVNRWGCSPVYLESRYNEIYVALEAYARIRAKRSSSSSMPAMDKILRVLARGEVSSRHEVITGLQSGLPDNATFREFRGIVGDADKWSKEMTRGRSNVVIHPGVETHRDAQRGQLYPLFESGYLLAVLCLFSEAGISDAAGREMCTQLVKYVQAVEPPLFE